MNLFLRWPELDASVRCLPALRNPEVHAWLLDNTPMQALQSHAVVSGELMYALNLRVNSVPPFQYNQLGGQLLTSAPIGSCWIILAYGKTAGFMVKWGNDMTEDMSYPDAARVHPEDLQTLARVGGEV